MTGSYWGYVFHWGEDARGDEDGRKIGRGEPQQHCGDPVRCGYCGQYAGEQSEREQPESVPKYEPDEARAAGAESHADAELARAAPSIYTAA